MPSSESCTFALAVGVADALGVAEAVGEADGESDGVGAGLEHAASASRQATAGIRRA
jgi:hypothetical protein